MMAQSWIARAILSLEVFTFGTAPLMAADADIGVQRSEYEIQARTAGQVLRQPEAEAKWQEQLFSLPAIQDQNMDSSTAADLVQAARAQAPLVDTYLLDIWHKFSGAQSHPLENTPNCSLKTDVNHRDDIYEDTHIFLFISETVPIPTIINYLKDLEGLNATIVLRGVIGENPAKFLPTQKWVQSFLCEDKNLSNKTNCFSTKVDINPNLYRQFGINIVPTVVYIPDVIKINFCDTHEKDSAKILSWIGDVSLLYVLKQFQRERPFDSILKKYIIFLEKIDQIQGGI